MSKYLKPADAQTVSLVAETIEKYHPELEEARITYGVWYYDDPDKEAELDARSRPVPLLKRRGYPAAATIRIESYESRAKGLPDATIQLDRGLWQALKPAEREALIDHELQHLQVVRDEKTTEIKHDNAGRPRLKMRLHDVQLGVFDAIIRRHGNAAIDTQVVRACHERYRQTAFQWGDDMAEQDPAPQMDLTGANA